MFARLGNTVRRILLGGLWIQHGQKSNFRLEETYFWYSLKYETFAQFGNTTLDFVFFRWATDFSLNLAKWQKFQFLMKRN